MAEKNKNLQAAMDEIAKKYGKGSVMYLGENHHMDVAAIPTGILELDDCLGIGGVPQGRIIEVFGNESAGKSSLALHIAKEAQDMGKVCAYIDAEHALDPAYARAIGVDIDGMLIAQPDTGEEGLDICLQLCKSDEVGLIVVDSVSALTPRAEIEGDVGDAHVGLQARMMSQGLRMITGAAQRSGTTVVFINQLREKIGVMFGCLHGSTKIPFVSGESYTIKEIVENEIQGEVWSFNEESGNFEPARIVDWHYNGEGTLEDFIHIRSLNPGAKNGFAGITVTSNHEVHLENKGWVEAAEVELGDVITSKFESRINGSLADFLDGCFVGDSHIAVRSHNTACIRFQDSNDPDYLQWKIAKLSPFFEFSEQSSGSLVRVSSTYETDIAMRYGSIERRDPNHLLDNFTPLGMALWYMDDGHLDRADTGAPRAIVSVKRFRGEADKLRSVADRLEKALTDGWGKIRVGVKDGSLTLDSDTTKALMEMVGQYVPPCMRRKMLEGSPEYIDFELASEKLVVTCGSPVVMIRKASKRQGRDLGKFDLSVEGNSNYLAGSTSSGVLVHNSPETTSGGRALRFYASVRISLTRLAAAEKDKATGIQVSNQVNVNVVKNKVAPPFRKCTLDIDYGTGFSRASSLFNSAEKFGVIKKSGAWIVDTETGETICQGRAAFKELAQDDGFYDEYMERVLAAMSDDGSAEA